MSEEPVVSPVLLWEIAIKVSLGKLTADVSRICQVITEQGFERLGYFDRHMISLQSLPYHHRDPFDCMLVVQSIVEGMPLLSSDKKIALYEADMLDCTQ